MFFVVVLEEAVVWIGLYYDLNKKHFFEIDTQQS